MIHLDFDALGLILVNRTGGSYSGSLAEAQAFRNIEAGLHELCHAAVFGFDPLDQHQFHDLATRIARRFDTYTSMRASDKSEIAALAVELIIIRRLALNINVNAVIEGARTYEDNMFAEVRRAARQATNQKRADQVLEWMKGFWEEHQPIRRVEIGQVWRHNDPRMKGREFIIDSIEGATVLCRQVDNRNQPPV